MRFFGITLSLVLGLLLLGSIITISMSSTYATVCTTSVWEYSTRSDAYGLVFVGTLTDINSEPVVPPLRHMDGVENTIWTLTFDVTQTIEGESDESIELTTYDYGSSIKGHDYLVFTGSSLSVNGCWNQIIDLDTSNNIDLLKKTMIISKANDNFVSAETFFNISNIEIIDYDSNSYFGGEEYEKIAKISGKFSPTTKNDFIWIQITNPVSYRYGITSNEGIIVTPDNEGNLLLELKFPVLKPTQKYIVKVGIFNEGGIMVNNIPFELKTFDYYKTFNVIPTHDAYNLHDNVIFDVYGSKKHGSHLYFSNDKINIQKLPSLSDIGSSISFPDKEIMRSSFRTNWSQIDGQGNSIDSGVYRLTFEPTKEQKRYHEHDQFIITIVDQSDPINENISSYLDEQLQLGLDFFEISCKLGHEPIFKIQDQSINCVNSQSIKKLIERNWGSYYLIIR